MNVFEQMASNAVTRRNEIFQKIKDSLNRKKKQEPTVDMQQAEECALIMQDGRYPGQQEYLSKTIKTCRDALQAVLVRDINRINREDTLLKACTIAAKIEAYTDIMERPQKVLKETDELRKMVEKETN